MMNEFIKELAFVCIGGVVGVMDGVDQSAFALKKDLKQQRMLKREDAYLSFILALLSVVVDDSRDKVLASEFWPISRDAQARIYLYGSKKQLNCYKIFNGIWMNVGKIIVTKELNKKLDLVSELRKELGMNN